MSSGLINGRTLIPPVPVGRGMTDEEWNERFPGSIRKNYESEAEYRDRVGRHQDGARCGQKVITITTIDGYGEYIPTIKVIPVV